MEEGMLARRQIKRLISCLTQWWTVANLELNVRICKPDADYLRIPARRLNNKHGHRFWKAQPFGESESDRSR